MKNWRLWGCLLILCFALAGWCAADAAYAAEKKSPAVENADFASLTKELNGIEEFCVSSKRERLTMRPSAGMCRFWETSVPVCWKRKTGSIPA